MQQLIAAEVEGYVGDGQLTQLEAELAVADSRSVAGAKRRLVAQIDLDPAGLGIDGEAPRCCRGRSVVGGSRSPGRAEVGGHRVFCNTLVAN